MLFLGCDLWDKSHYHNYNVILIVQALVITAGSGLPVFQVFTATLLWWSLPNNITEAAVGRMGAPREFYRPSLHQ